MAIDLKNIIGQGKSTILSPAEIADLGMRKRQMQQQEQRFQLSKDQSTIDSIVSNAGSYNTAERLNSGLAVLDTIESNDPSINASKTLARDVLENNLSKVQKVQELEERFNQFDTIDKDLYKKKFLEAEDFWNVMNDYNKLAAELGNEEYANYISPELLASFKLKSDNYGMIGDALITGNKITEEEWKAMSSGNRARFQQAKKEAITEIDLQFDYNQKRLNAYENTLTNFRIGLADSSDDDILEKLLESSDIKNAMSEIKDLDGVNLDDASSTTEIIGFLQDQIDVYKNNLQSISERNEVWRGQKKYIGDTSLSDDEFLKTLNKTGQGSNQTGQGSQDNQFQNKSQFSQQDQDFVTSESEDRNIKTSKIDKAKSTRFENQPDPGDLGQKFDASDITAKGFKQDPSVQDFTNIQGQLNEASSLQNKLKKGKFGKDSIKRANALKTIRQIDGITKELKSVERSKKEYKRLISELNELSNQQGPLLTEKERKRLAKKKKTIQRRINELGDRQRKIVRFGGTGAIELQSSVGGLSTFNTRGFSDLDGNFEVLNMEALPKYFAEIEAKFAEKLNEYSKDANDLLK